ncbi:MAG: hypothetical protein NT070_20935 [Cyanobacteria bacterium]|nr:hypothetical protein [Cyanobacteriota bacterium]
MTRLYVVTLTSLFQIHLRRSLNTLIHLVTWTKNVTRKMVMALSLSKK